MFGLGSSLVNSSLSQSIGGRQAEERLNANQAANGLFGIGAAKAYWGSGPGTPFVDTNPYGNGGGGGGLGSSFADAYNAARNANEKRYGDILKGYDDRISRGMSDIRNVGGHERTRINQAYDNLQGSRQQGLVGGAFNSTVRQNMNAGVARERTDALGGLEDRLRMNSANLGSQLTGDKLGFMERRNDNYPDLNQLLALQQGLGQGGYGAGGLFGGGGWDLGNNLYGNGSQPGMNGNGYWIGGNGGLGNGWGMGLARGGGGGGGGGWGGLGRLGGWLGSGLGRGIGGLFGGWGGEGDGSTGAKIDDVIDYWGNRGSGGYGGGGSGDESTGAKIDDVVDYYSQRANQGNQTLYSDGGIPDTSGDNNYVNFYQRMLDEEKRRLAGG